MQIYIINIIYIAPMTGRSI